MNRTMPEIPGEGKVRTSAAPHSIHTEVPRDQNGLIEDLRLLSPPAYGLWLAVALLLFAAGLVFFRARRSRALATVAAPHDAGSSPWDTALAGLERLVPYLQREYSRDYGFASTAILRSYIESRYAFRAPKLATEEFLFVCGNSPEIPGAHRDRLMRYLELCDLLKFGRYVAASDELVALHEAAIAFVLASVPTEVACASSARSAEPPPP